MKKRKLFILNFIVLLLINMALPLGSYEAKAAGGTLINLNFVPVDSVIDPNRPILYIVSSSSKSVYSINYKTGEKKKVDFNLQPERITIANDKIYVTLLKMQHQYYTESPLQGAVGIIDASNFTVSGQFDISMDPYDIEADTNGNIYITPGSNQWENLEIYSADTKTKIGEAGSTYMSSLIQLNPVNSKLYLITTQISPRDISAYGFSGGSFRYLQDSPYHGDYKMDTNIRISPDGRFIFNGAGTIFNGTNLQSTDMTYVNKLSSGFTDVSFGENKIYAGLKDGNIATYDYDSFKQVGIISTSGKVVNLYHKDNSLISLSKLLNNAFAIEVIDLVNTDSQTVDNSSSGNLINLNFVPVDSVIDPKRPILYIVSSSSKSVYSINYKTGEKKKVDFNLQPERITIANDKIYVTLLKMQHQYYTESPLQGAVGIIDASNFTVSGQFDISMDPYDIEADTNGNIYITPGSNQWENLEVYSADTKTKIGEAGLTYMSSLIQLNPVSSKLYLTTTPLSPRDISTYGFSQNSFRYLYDSPYHGDYEMDTNIRISPDGKFIFNGAGTIFNSTDLQSTDMTYVNKLSSGFNDVSFSENNIYAGLKDGNIATYDYDSFKQVGTISTSGKVVNLYHKDNSLISLSKLLNNTFAVEVINLLNTDSQAGNNSSSFSLIDNYPEQGSSTASVSGYIVLNFNDIVNIDPSKEILGDCTVKNYVTNKTVLNNQLILYYDNLNYNSTYNLKLNAAAIVNSVGTQLPEDYSLNFTTGSEFIRLSGASRYETSVEISKFGGSHADCVVLASGENFPDALCAAPLATKYGAPILLTYNNSLPAAVESEIDRLNPKEVFLIGGTGVLSDSIKTVLQNKGIKTTRLSGQNRYETSLEIAKYVNSSSNEVFVVNGENYPDALSIASYAANKGIAILLTDKNNLPDNIKSYVSSMGISKTYVIGGAGVITDKVMSSLPSPERIAGNNRYETNFEVLSRFPFVYDETYFSTGQSFPDALSGAALAGAFNNPIILIDTSMPEDIIQLLNQNKDMMKMKKILGGTGVVSNSIIDKIFK